MDWALNDVLDTALPVGLPMVRVGGDSLTASMSSITLSLRDDKVPVADVTLKHPVPPFDYFAEMTVVDGEGDAARPRFTGTIISAVPIDGGLRVQASGMTEFMEFAVAPWVTRNVDPLDLIYLLARTSGISDERIQIDFQNRPALETFEIVVPVRGCRVERAVALTDGVRLIPSHLMRFGTFGDEKTLGQLRQPFDAADTLAVTQVSHVRRLFQAEELGLAAIQDALAWLVVRLRVGASQLADGELRGFVRSDARAEIKLADVVCATGLMTGRRWIRDRNVPLAPATFEARDLDSLPGRGLRPETRLRQAVSALARASDEARGTLERLNAFWEALEFFAAEVALPSVFTRAEARALRKRANLNLSNEQVKRLDFAISQLNATPLMARVWERASRNGTRVSDGDREVIARLRELRNDIVHGRASVSPLRTDFEHGVSIVARLLVSSAQSPR